MPGKLNRFRELDSSATHATQASVLSFGIICILILSFGMCLF